MRDTLSAKRIEQLHPKVRQKFTDFINECEAVFNTTFRIAQGFRTFAEQDAIYNQPRDGKDNDGDGKIDEADEKVTKVNGGYSYHNYGLAIDIVEIKDGKINWNFDYKKLKPIADRYKLDWGMGIWGFDNPHYHYDFGYSVSTLLRKYQRKEFIPGTYFLNL